MKEKKENVEKTEQTPLKTALFLVFYAIFFIIIIFLLRTGYKENSKKITRNNSGYGYNFKLTRLENKNYHFTFIEENNDVITVYEGDRKGEMLSYKKSGLISTEYYQDYNQIKYKNPNTLIWENSLNPMIFDKFINPNYIKNIINHSTYKSKTIDIDTEETSYNYEIPTNILIRIFENKTIELDDKENTLSVVLDKEGKIKEINYDLTSYYKYYNPTTMTYKLTTKYSRYDQIKEIETP